MSKRIHNDEGKPCTGADCENRTCKTCGHNPEEAERRKQLIAENGLTQQGDTKRLIINRREK